MKTLGSWVGWVFTWSAMAAGKIPSCVVVSYALGSDGEFEDKVVRETLSGGSHRCTRFGFRDTGAF
jgi:hypothetical protein